MRFVSTIIAVAAALSVAHPLSALAQAYPSRPLQIVVGYAPGGANDVSARAFAALLSKQINQPVIIENKPGASGVLAHRYVAESKPDGYTIILSSLTDAVNVSLAPNAGYDFLKDFSPVARLTTSSFYLGVNPSIPVKTLSDLVAYSKAKDINYASSGVGTTSQLAAELLKLRAGIVATHVPYSGAGPVTAAIISGEVQFGFLNAASGTAFVQSGQVRALAISTLQRLSATPDVPTLSESGAPGFDVGSWGGIQVAAGTPRQIVDRLSDAALTSMKSPDAQASLRKIGVEPAPLSSADFAQFLKDEVVKWGDVTKQAGIKPQ